MASWMGCLVGFAATECSSERGEGWDEAVPQDPGVRIRTGVESTRVVARVDQLGRKKRVGSSSSTAAAANHSGRTPRRRPSDPVR